MLFFDGRRHQRGIVCAGCIPDWFASKTDCQVDRLPLLPQSGRCFLESQQLGRVLKRRPSSWIELRIHHFLNPVIVWVMIGSSYLPRLLATTWLIGKEPFFRFANHHVCVNKRTPAQTTGQDGSRPAK